MRLLQTAETGSGPAGSGIADKVSFGGVNIDEERELAEQFKVETIPSLMLVKDGQCSELLVNPPSKAAVKTWLQEKGVLWAKSMTS